MTFDEVMDAVRLTLNRVRSLCDNGDNSLLTFIITDGVTLVGTQGGRELYVSTYKTRCSDREHCPSLSPA